MEGPGVAHFERDEARERANNFIEVATDIVSRFDNEYIRGIELLHELTQSSMFIYRIEKFVERCEGGKVDFSIEVPANMRK